MQKKDQPEQGEINRKEETDTVRLRQVGRPRSLKRRGQAETIVKGRTGERKRQKGMKNIWELPRLSEVYID